MRKVKFMNGSPNKNGNTFQNGFGLSEETSAECWIDNAIKFWERNMK